MKTRKRILHLITGLEIGGAENMLLKTLPLIQDKLDNRVCCIMGHGPVGKKLEDAGIPVYYLNLKSVMDVAVINRFRHIVNDFKPDLLVTYLIHADLFGRILGRFFGIKKIVCSVRVKLVQLKYLPLLLLDAMTSFLVTCYHFNSQTVADMYRKYFFLSEKKIIVIPNGLDVKKYNIKIDVGKKKQEVGVPLDKIIIGCVAKLRRQKGHKFLISAFAEVVKEYPNVFLLLVGDGDERSNIEEQIKKLEISDNVLMLGNRDDISELLQIMDIFVLPTLFEGMSNAIMEAMAAGRVVIATDIPENRELIKDGISGVFFKKGKISDLDVKILEVLKNKIFAKNIGIEAGITAQKIFDINNVVNNLSDLYLSV